MMYARSKKSGLWHKAGGDISGIYLNCRSSMVAINVDKTSKRIPTRQALSLCMHCFKYNPKTRRYV